MSAKRLKSAVEKASSAVGKIDRELEAIRKKRVKSIVDDFKKEVRAAFADFFARWPDIEWVTWVQYDDGEYEIAPDWYNSDAKVLGKVIKEWCSSSEKSAWKKDLEDLFCTLDNKYLMIEAFGMNKKIRVSRGGFTSGEYFWG